MLKKKKKSHYETRQFQHLTTFTQWPGIPKEKPAWWSQEWEFQILDSKLDEN